MHVAKNSIEKQQIEIKIFNWEKYSRDKFFYGYIIESSRTKWKYDIFCYYLLRVFQIFGARQK